MKYKVQYLPRLYDGWKEDRSFDDLDYAIEYAKEETVSGIPHRVVQEVWNSDD